MNTFLSALAAVGLLSTMVSGTATAQGVIRGKVSPGGQIERVACIDRKNTVEKTANFQQLHSKSIIGTITDTGDFQIGGLPEGEYDLILLLKNGMRVEGVNLHWGDYHNLDDAARIIGERGKIQLKSFLPQVDADAANQVAEEQNDIFALEDDEEAKPKPLSSLDRRMILDLIKNMRLHENKHRPIYLTGEHGKQAKVFMELIRDRKTSFDGQFGQSFGTIRYELWTFRSMYGMWAREKLYKVYYRVGLGVSDLRKQTWLWDPRLGGILVRHGRPTPVIHYDLPLKPDPHMGLVPN